MKTVCILSILLVIIFPQAAPAQSLDLLVAKMTTYTKEKRQLTALGGGQLRKLDEVRKEKEEAEAEVLKLAHLEAANQAAGVPNPALAEKIKVVKKKQEDAAAYLRGVEKVKVLADELREARKNVPLDTWGKAIAEMKKQVGPAPVAPGGGGPVTPGQTADEVTKDIGGSGVTLLGQEAASGQQ